MTCAQDHTSGRAETQGFSVPSSVLTSHLKVYPPTPGLKGSRGPDTLLTASYTLAHFKSSLLSLEGSIIIPTLHTNGGRGEVLVQGHTAGYPEI